MRKQFLGGSLCKNLKIFAAAAQFFSAHGARFWSCPPQAKVEKPPLYTSGHHSLPIFPFLFSFSRPLFQTCSPLSGWNGAGSTLSPSILSHLNSLFHRIHSFYFGIQSFVIPPLTTCLDPDTSPGFFPRGGGANLTSTGRGRNCNFQFKYT